MADPETAGPEGVRGRAARYASLRSVHRLLAGSRRLLETDSLNGEFRELRVQLRELSGGDGAGAGPGLASIDAKLDGIANALRERAGAIPLAQHRARLPVAREDHREDVEAFLDLWLAAPETIEEHWSILDYVITLLATKTRAGRLHLTRDPTELTPRLRALTEAHGREHGAAAQGVAQALDEARMELAHSELPWPIVERMRSFKSDHSEHLLVPEVLRAVITYNIAVRNRCDDIEEVDRVLEEAERLGLDDNLEATAEAEILAADSVIGSVALERLAAALRTRFSDEVADGPPSGLAAEVAARLDRSTFTVYEEAAFSADGEDPERELIQAAICLGLLARNLEADQERLDELETDLETLVGVWLPEIDRRIRVAIRGCLMNDRYDVAQRLAEVRTKFLHGELDGRSGWDLEQDPEGGFAKRLGFRLSGRGSRRAPRGGSRFYGWVDLIKAGVGVSLILGAIGIYLASGSEGNVKIFSEAQLLELSPYLESGYRSHYGAGPLFIGTVSELWADIPLDQQVSRGQAIGDRLLKHGVKEIMLFDADRRMRVHYKRGDLYHPLRSN